MNNVGIDEWALEELARAAEAGPNSPKVNLAIARVYRYQEDNVRALNVLKKSFPDYSQMKPEEMTREQWDVFYPLAYWDIIVQESRARNLDPYQVAGLIRQETVFDPRAKSPARAYGLMQVLVPTATLTARKYGVERSITADRCLSHDSTFKSVRLTFAIRSTSLGASNTSPLLTTRVQLARLIGALLFRQKLMSGLRQCRLKRRVATCRAWFAIACSMNGSTTRAVSFRQEVGTRAITAQPEGSTPADSTVRKRRVIGDEEEE